MAFPPLENSNSVFVSVSIDFSSYSQQDSPFHCIAYDYYCVDWDGVCDHLRNLPWENMLTASVTAREFCEWVKVGILE